MLTAKLRQIILPVAHTGQKCALLKTAPSRFGTRKRRSAAKGHCKCGAPAIGVQPLHVSPKVKLTLMPACDAHRWPQFGNRDGRRSARIVAWSGPSRYTARSTYNPPRAMSAGFEIVREDGQIVAAGCGADGARQWWNPRSGVELTPTASLEQFRVHPAWQAALEAGEGRVTVLCDEAHGCNDLTDDEAYNAGYHSATDPEGAKVAAWLWDGYPPGEIRSSVESAALGFGCGASA